MSPGVSHYNTADGVAAGFGYTGLADTIAVGKHTGGGIPATMTTGNLMFWNGRAFTEEDFTTLWNNHAGRDFRLTDVHGRVVREILA